MINIECTESIKVEQLDDNLFNVTRNYILTSNNGSSESKKETSVKHKVNREEIIKFIEFYRNNKQVDISGILK